MKARGGKGYRSTMKLTTIIAAAAVALTAQGCIASKGDTTSMLTLQIEDGFTPAEQQAIQDAVTAWMRLTGYDYSTMYIAVQPGGCGTAMEQQANTTCVHPGWASDEDAFEPGETYKHGWNGQSDIFLPPTAPYDSGDSAADLARFTQVAAHEIGHAMGLLHTQPGTVMFHGAEKAAMLPTCDDLAQYLSIRGMRDSSPECPSGGSFTLEFN